MIGRAALSLFLFAPAWAGEGFYSKHLGAFIDAYPGVPFTTRSSAVKGQSDAEISVLPLMKQHAEIFKGKTALDIGTGTGIMALYAAKLGASKVVATEINPEAIRNARDNAKRLGLDAVIETRLVREGPDPIYSALKEGETFDVVMANMPGLVGDVDPKTGALTSVAPSLKLIMAIVSGLSTHLSPDGRAILRVPTRFGHDLIVRYARSLGFDVEHRPGLLSMNLEWCSVYNLAAAQVAASSGLQAAPLLMTPGECDDSPIAAPDNDPKCVYERNPKPALLWGREPGEHSAGLIVIRRAVKPAPRP